MIVWDMEATGLEDTSDTHCIVVFDRRTQQWIRAVSRREQEDAVRLIMSGPNIAHNQIEYDQYVLRHNFPWFKPHPQSIDTLVMSRILFTDPIFRHGLEAWGERVGVSKPPVTDWSTQPIEVYVNRCEEDVRINSLMYDELIKRMKEVGGDWKEAFRLEHAVSEVHSRQHRLGCHLDKQLCEDNITDLNNIREKISIEVTPELPYTFDVKESKIRPWSDVDSKVTSQEGWKWVAAPFTQTGSLRAHVAKHLGEEYTPDHIAGPFTRVDFRKCRVSEREPVIKFLLESGWRPAQWNFKKDPDNPKRDLEVNGKKVISSPKLSKNDPFDGITTDAGKKIATFIVAGYRIGDCNRFLKHLRPDGSVPTAANPQGTQTARYAHKIVCNIAGGKAFYAERMRSLFMARPGQVFVNADVDSCQFFALANHMNDPVFTAAVEDGDPDEGTDLHSLNSEMWTDVLGKEVDRPRAKGGGFAFIFGAGDSKLGRTLVPSTGGAREGKLAKSAIQTRFPSLKSLITRLQAQVKAFGYVTALDGRRIFVDSPHKALNYVCQSDESIFVKHWMVNVDRLITKYGLAARQILEYHDELSYECPPGEVEQLKALIVKGADLANDKLKLSPRMRVTPSVGTTWWNSH